MGEFNLVPPGDAWRAALGIDGPDSAGFRPESARIGEIGAPAVVRSARFLGSKAELIVEMPGAEPLKIWTTEPVAADSAIRFTVPSGEVIRLPRP
jgi:hypothetical protein